jgi:hypothetical protein
MHVGILIITAFAVFSAGVVFILVLLNEVRLEARLMIVHNFNKRGRIELDNLEKEFARKLMSMSANNRNIELEDLDLIFIDYLADRNFLDNFSQFLKREAISYGDGFKICKSKLNEIESLVEKWANSRLMDRIPKKYFDETLNKDWKVQVLFLTLPSFFQKRALNFLKELKEAFDIVAKERVEVSS